MEPPQKRLNSHEHCHPLAGSRASRAAFRCRVIDAGFSEEIMINFKSGCAIAAIALALPMVAASSSHAAPLAGQSAVAAQANTSNSLVTEVQWRRRGYGYGYRRGWGPGAGVGIGLAAGALIGGAIAAGSAPYYGPGYYGGPAYYPAPAPVYGGDAVAYCMQRYRSYDPASGTYLNYDGNRYPCP